MNHYLIHGYRRLAAMAVFALAMIGSVVYAASLQYSLTAQQVAEKVWVVEGLREDFSRQNGGNIVNTAFLQTSEGVLVIDTGPSLRYGKALRALAEKTTGSKVFMVINTHHHPDHFLGNQAFSDLPIASLGETHKLIERDGNSFAENMYRLVGDWMRGTEVYTPNQTLTEGEWSVGDRTFSLYSYTGHSGSDLVLFDQTTGVLFASDMVFYQRALTTPHTVGLSTWKEQLEEIKKLSFKVLVPGHGPVVRTHAALDQMIDYLTWLDELLTQSAKQGLSMNEVMALSIPERFSAIALTQAEFNRTVVHLYGSYEDQWF